jgi:predicted metal-dependent phosphoesterase TrpH
VFDAFAAPGQFYKGNIHTHSNRSDGRLPPEEVCRRYRDAGYDFLCISDHFLEKFGFPLTDTEAFRTETFSTILGAELHAPATHLGDLWHILAVGLPGDFAATRADEAGPQLAARAAAAGAFIGIAHPQWYGLDFTDGLALDAAHAVEIYNHACEMLSARPDGVSFFDDLLRRGRRLGLYAADDAHFYNADAFGGWVNVKSESLDPSALVAALKQGNHYSSQGPEIFAVEWSGDRIRVVTSPVRSLVLAGPRATAVAVHGSNLTEADLDPGIFRNSWCRLVVTAEDGRRAWTQPEYLVSD